MLAWWLNNVAASVGSENGEAKSKWRNHSLGGSSWRRNTMALKAGLSLAINQHEIMKISA